jgi:DNA-binding winged helix-turn-helix (wHTH) protein
MAYRFGPFVYDSVRHELVRGRGEIPLTRKSRELLLLFLRNPGRLLGRQEIVDRVWGGTAVTDDAVRFQVTDLRKALAEDGGNFIRTIRGEGYRWEEPVRAASDRRVRPMKSDAATKPEPRFRLVLGSHEVQLLPGENVVGRDPDAALWIDHPGVSRRHARILVAGGKATLEDLGSKNGTFLGGEKLTGRVALADRDEIRIGPETIVFRMVSPGTTRSERQD